MGFTSNPAHSLRRIGDPIRDRRIRLSQAAVSLTANVIQAVPDDHHGVNGMEGQVFGQVHLVVVPIVQASNFVKAVDADRFHGICERIAHDQNAGKLRAVGADDRLRHVAAHIDRVLHLLASARQDPDRLAGHAASHIGQEGHHDAA